MMSNFIDETIYIPAIASIIYLVAMYLSKRIKVTDIVLTVMLIPTMFITHKELYFTTLSVVSIIQAIILAKDKNPVISSKYIIYSMCFITCGSPLMKGIEVQFLISLLSIKTLFACYEQETENRTIFYSNLLIIFSIVTQYTHQISNELTMLVIASLILSSVLMMLNERIKNPIHLLPFFLILSINNPFYTTAIYLYTILVSLLTRTKETTNAIILTAILLLVFIDDFVFYKLISETAPANLAWITTVLTSICVSLYLEKITKKEIKNRVTYAPVIYFILSLSTLGYFIILDGWSMNSPIPLISAIPLILLNGFYFKIVSRLKIQQFIPWAIKKAKVTTKSKAKNKISKNKSTWPLINFIKIIPNKIDKSLLEINTSTIFGVILLAIITTLVFMRWVV